MCALGVLAACNGGSPPVPNVPAGPDLEYAGGVLFHRPHYAPTLRSTPSIAPLFFLIPYRGGSVITAPKFYFTFWGYKKYGDPDKVQPLLEAYAKSMGGSPHNNIEVQYYEGASGSKTYITNPKNQYGGSWNDESAVPKSPTDSQVAAEALKAVAHFGLDANGVYFVATAHKRSEVGFPTYWCSYHSYTFMKKAAITYAYFPYMPDGGKGCGEGVVRGTIRRKRHRRRRDDFRRSFNPISHDGEGGPLDPRFRNRRGMARGLCRPRHRSDQRAAAVRRPRASERSL